MADVGCKKADKFPAHYMFELSSSELRDLKSKILISNVSPNNRKPTVYTLSTLIKASLEVIT